MSSNDQINHFHQSSLVLAIFKQAELFPQFLFLSALTMTNIIHQCDVFSLALPKQGRPTFSVIFNGKRETKMQQIMK